MLKVMIVEDEPSAMERYSNYIENYGNFLSVIAKARTFAEGWEAFKKEPPDILFSDIRIPGENGLELAKGFRDSGWKGYLVIISGYDDFTYAQKAIQINVSDYLLKPVFQEDINKILDKLMEKHKGDSRHRTLSSPIDSQWPEHICKAQTYIDIHLEDEISLIETADYAHVSPSYLSSSFHKVRGITFIEYVRKNRISRAMELLKNTNLPLRTIGEKCGLPDPSYFNRSFRKITGISPSQFRQRQDRNI